MLKTEELIADYLSGNGVEFLCRKYHLGKLKVKDILKKSDVPMKTRGGQSKKETFIVPHWSILKYKEVPGKHYVASSKDGNLTTHDYLNKSGILTSYIKKTYGKESTLYERRKYYMKTGNYWWEQWFNIILADNTVTKKCPYCDWETVDLENKSGAFAIHLLKTHGLSVNEYLEKNPEDKQYFSNEVKKNEKEKLLEDNRNFVFCPICGEKMEKITPQHIFYKHHLNFIDFRNKYPNAKVLSDNMYDETIRSAKVGNLTVSKKRFISKYEREIQDFLKTNGVKFMANRQILDGREIDLLIEEKKVGIEFDGLRFHTEWFGKKNHGYHLEKTKKCNEHGYGLIHIFEDEYVNHREIVYSKISHALGLDFNKLKIGARKCTVREIQKSLAEKFLEKFHIQGFSSSSLYLGAFYKDELVGVMTFKHGNLKNYCWELTRFATNNKYIYQGLGSKMFSFFVKKESPDMVVSFADRRWTINPNENLYTKMGFTLDSINPPDYKYYNDRVDRFKRVHKMFFSKTKLCKKYGFPPSMTETEMAKALGYDRIWDCGLFKYVWKSPDITQENHPA